MKRRMALSTLSLPVIALPAALLAATAAQAGGTGYNDAGNSDAGYYVSGMGGGSFLPDLHLRTINAGVPQSGFNNEEFNTGYAYGGAVGYDTGQGWRVEVQSLYQRSSLNRLGGTVADGHLSTTSLMLNGTYDLASWNNLTPFVGAGLGMQNVGGEIEGLGGHQWRPAYQLEAGLRANIAPNTSLFGAYRFSQAESARMEDVNDPTLAGQQHFSNHALLAGITYKFSNTE